MEEFEVVLDYITHMDSFKDECLALTDLIYQEYQKDVNDLFYSKLSSAAVYIYSVVSFNKKIFIYITENVSSIYSVIMRKEEPESYPEFKEQSYVMF